jgi:hypothetical protein
MASRKKASALSGKQIEIESGSAWGKLPLIGGVLALAGLGGAAATAPDAGELWHAILVGYMFVLALGLGGMFFSIVQHLVRAGWSVAVRRISESLAITVPVTALFGFVIIFAGGPHVFEWMHHEVPYETTDARICGQELLDKATKFHETHGHGHQASHAVPDGDEHGAGQAAHVNKFEATRPEPYIPSCFKLRPIEEDVMLWSKASYLNSNAITIRMTVYWVVWTFLALMFWGQSRKMDTLKDPAEIAVIANRLRFWAAPGVMMFGLSMTFSAFDFLMSLDPHWFSTIFGVYFFASAMVATYSFMAITIALLQRSGYMVGVVTQEHFHDIGKFMFGFTVFWAYIGFSQYFLIWYADIPEETHWFAYRGHGSWLTLSLVLVFGRFVLPWFFLLRRGIKRNSAALIAIGAFILSMLFVDMFWLVQPAQAHHQAVEALIEGDFELAHQFETTFVLHAADVLAWLGAFGVFLAMFGWSLTSGKLVPIKDPRLDESLNHENF